MWTKKDIAWLNANYPGLAEFRPGEITGMLEFSMSRAGGVYTVNPLPLTGVEPDDNLLISDSYEIRITWPTDESMPIAFETGGKLAETAYRLGKNLMDMHQNDTTSALCIASDMALDRAFRGGFSLEQYVEGFLVPYLFAQTHFDRTQEWLWGELSHGEIGILEWLGRQAEPTERDIQATAASLQKHVSDDYVVKLLATRLRAHRPCLCGSSRQGRECHPEIIRAVGLLRSSSS